ncbi:IPT/TIG domain-containing protein [Candidatus Saganbacteria bacterium]|nr:IPT/TIG domain-containing protein [Candidatus Saganbacteria bacterium]
MRSRISKAIGGMIVGLMLVMSFSTAAYAVAVTISSSGTNVPPNQIYNNTGVGGTLLATGAFVQIIQSPDGTAGDPDPTTGAPAGDTIITPTGTLSAPGTFSASRNIAASNYVYIRAWETWNGVGVPSGRWGTSTPASVGTGFAFTYRPASFATTVTWAPPSAGTLQFSAATYSVVENVATATITVTRTGGSSGAVGVSYASSNGTATAGSDYTAASGTLSWASGDSASKTFTVAITPDTIDELNETVILTLSAPTGGATLGSPNPATLTITDDDPTPPGDSVTVNTPNGGETLDVGATYNITWTSSGITNARIRYSTDGGATWTVVIASTPAAAGTYAWTVPNTPTTQGRVEIADAADSTPIDTSNANFTIQTVTPATSVLIDDYEGTAVNPLTGYYNAGFSGVGTPVPTMTRVTGAANVHEGTYGMNTVYAAGAASPNDWRGWGGVLTSAKNISATNTISFWLKGDGSANKVKIQFKDADGSNYGVTDADAVSLTDTTWKEYKIPVNRVTNQITAGTTAGLDLANIIEYQFVFSGTAASSGVLIDYVVATTEIASTNPQIISITPATAAVGDTITIAGANLDVAGTVQFITEGGVITAVNSTATNTPITAWSAASVTMRVPSMGPGAKSVKIVRSSDLLESNEVSFEVTATAAPADSATNAYPNPFNPLGGETTKIVFSPGSAAKADIYIFDMTAKLVQKLNWPTTGSTRPDGRVEVTWDGKNSYGEIVGDGVYLYRVVDGGVRKGKILVVNKK